MPSSPSLNPAAGVTGTAFTSATVTSATLTTTVSNTVIFACVYCNTGPGSVTGVTSVTGGLAFTNLASKFNSTTNGASVWYLASSGTFSDTIKATFNVNAGNSIIHCFGVQGCNSISTPFDPHAGLPVTATGTTSPAVVTYSTTNADDLILSALEEGGNVAGAIPGIPTGFTSIGGTSNANGQGNVYARTALLSVSAAQSSSTVSSTIGTLSNSWASIVWAVTADSAAATIPPGKQSFDTAQPDPNTLRSIQLRGFENRGGQILLTAQDKFNPGKQWYDTPPAWLVNSDPFSQWRTWQWQYRPILIGQDKFNPGQQWYATPDTWLYPDPFARERSWTGNYNLNLIGKDQLPTGQQLNYLPSGQAPDSFAQWRSWTGSYNLNLIGKDQLPTGARFYDLPASQVYDPFARWRSWIGNYNLNLIGQDKLNPGKQLYDRQVDPQDAFAQWRSWTGSYNLNLIGQDRFPPGKQWNELPRGISWLPDSPQQNISNTLLRPVVSAFPPGAQLWELSPRAQDYFAQWHSWTDSYNLNLIGQDQLPAGARLYDRQLDPQDGFAQWRSWTGWYNKNLIAEDFFPLGAQWDDAPPRGAIWQPDSPQQNLLTTTLSLTQSIPPGKQYSERPRFFFLM